MQKLFRLLIVYLSCKHSLPLPPEAMTPELGDPLYCYECNEMSTVERVG